MDYGKGSAADPGHFWNDVYTELSYRAASNPGGYDVYVVPSLQHATDADVVDSLGGFQYNAAQRMQNYLDSVDGGKGLRNRDVILVGHSMGGLIARRWASVPQLWGSRGIKPVGIVQLGTPNGGSPLASVAWGLPVLWDQLNMSTLQLWNDGPVIRHFNETVSNPEGLPILKMGGDFFFARSSTEVAVDGSSAKRFWNSVFWTVFLGSANDGAVSVRSLNDGPAPYRSTELYPVMHSSNEQLNTFTSQGFIIPTRGTAEETHILTDLRSFCDDLASCNVRAVPSASRILSGVTPLAVSSAALEAATDRGSAFTSIVSRSLTLSSIATSAVQFSVEGTSAMAEVLCADATLRTAVRSDSGPVSFERRATSSGVSLLFPTVPGGRYMVELRSGTSSAPAALTVLDSGATALVVDAQSSGVGGGDALVTARLERGSSNLLGSFAASIEGGTSLWMSDSGVGADATASDGVYSAFVRLPASGMASYVSVDATSTAGVTVQRTGFGLIEIVEPRATITSTPAISKGLVPSGKVGQVFVDVPVSASQNCTVQVAANLEAGGAVVAQATTQRTMTSASSSSIRINFDTQDLEGLSTGTNQISSTVKLFDSTDGGLSLLDSDAAPAISLFRSDLALASCTIDPMNGPASGTPVVLTGAAACTSETIAGIDISLDAGGEWLAVPEPSSGWGSNETTWSCAFTLGEGDYGARVRLRGQSGLIDGANDAMVFQVEGVLSDTTAPTTTSDAVAAYSNSATIVLTPTDNPGGSGVASTSWTLSGTQSRSGTGTSVTVTGAGTYHLEFWSHDVAGNVESPHKAADFSITVPQSNRAPVAVANSYSVAEDATLTVAAAGVLGNDTDADHDQLTANLVSNVSHGTLSLSANGSFTYRPAANYSGPDSFTYRAYDGAANSNTVTVLVTASAVNDAPIAAADSLTAAEDTVLTVPAPGVVANDTDVDGDALSASLVTSVAHGTLALSANGSLTYTSATDYSGPDSFTYRVWDGKVYSNTVTVLITVTAVKDVPVAVSDSYATVRDTMLTVAGPGVLGNDSDTDSQVLTASKLSEPANGSVLSFLPDGSFAYMPDPGFVGSDSFTYRAFDGDAHSGSVTVNITVLNAADVAEPNTTSDCVSDYTMSATIHLTPTDNPGGSGVAGTYYRLDGGEQISGTAITVVGTGAHTIEYWSVDAAGNVEAHRSANFTISLPRATVYKPVAPSTMRRGRSSTIYGYVAPSHASGMHLVTLKFYKKNSKGEYVYHHSKSARRYYYSSSKTKYKISTSLPHSGRWRVRAYHSCSTHAGSYSGYDYITVK